VPAPVDLSIRYEFAATAGLSSTPGIEVSNPVQNSKTPTFTISTGRVLPVNQELIADQTRQTHGATGASVHYSCELIIGRTIVPCVPVDSIELEFAGIWIQYSGVLIHPGH